MIFWSLGNNDSRSFFLIKFELDVQIQEVNPKMANKAELISEVAANTKLTNKQAAVAIDAIFSSIQNDLANGNKVQLIGFGTFEVRHRAARKGRNPQTGAEIEIPASEVPAFKPGKALKDAVK